MAVAFETVDAMEDRARTFTALGTPLLTDGTLMRLVALAPQLWIHAKVYATGGERQLHRHLREDHAFFVLSGTATFYDTEETETKIGPFEGIMIPRGVFYAFENTGEENLVLLRIGAAQESGGFVSGKESAVAGMRTELFPNGPDGQPPVKIKHPPAVYAEGKVFTAE